MHDLLKSNKIIIIFILLLILITKLIESISIISFAPILDFYINGQNHNNQDVFFDIKIIYKFIFNEITLLKLILFTSILFFIKSIFAFISKVSVIFFSYNISKILMNKLYSKLTNTDWLIFNKLSTENISNTINTEIEKFALLIEDYFEFIINIISIILFVIICFFLSYQLTIICFLMFLCFFIPNFFIENIIKKKSDNVLASKNAIFAILNETFSFFKNIQIFFLQSKFNKNFIDLTNHWYQNTRSLGFLKSFSNLYIEPSIILILGTILFLSREIYSIQVSQLFIFLFLFKKIADSFRNLINIRNNIKSYLPSIQQYNQISLSLKKFKNGSDNFNNLHSDIIFKNTFFSYDKKNILNNLSFKIKKDHINILIAPSGFGKTTIINLLLGLISLKKGSILINNLDIKNYNLEKWRKSISIVSQDLSFSNTSLFEFAKLLNPSITKSKLFIQLKLFNLNSKKFIYLGRHNAPLSGGEQQRLRIAISLINNPNILIFDEPTSSLDKDNKDIVIKEIIKSSLDRTSIIVTHDSYLRDSLVNLTNSCIINLNEKKT